jgi:hypothetical protein
MDARLDSTPSQFSDRVFRLLKRVEYRIAESSAEREAVFRLRYDAYRRNALLEPRADGQLYDERYDDAPNALITMTFLDGQLAGTTRVNVGAGENAVLPSLRVYQDVIEPQLRAGRVLIETTRLAAQLDISNAYAELAYLIMRPGYMAAEHFDVDYAVASPRAEHMAFYRRVLCFVPWCEPRPYPGLTANFGCMGANFHENKKRIEARYPFYRSTAAEREALFGPAPPRRAVSRPHAYEPHVGA